MNSGVVGAPAGLTEDREFREQATQSDMAPAPPAENCGAAGASGEEHATVKVPEEGLSTSWPGEPQDGD